MRSANAALATTGQAVTDGERDTQRLDALAPVGGEVSPNLPCPVNIIEDYECQSDSDTPCDDPRCAFACWRSLLWSMLWANTDAPLTPVEFTDNPNMEGLFTPECEAWHRSITEKVAAKIAALLSAQPPAAEPTAPAPCHSWEPHTGDDGRRGIYTWKTRGGWMAEGRCPDCGMCLTVDGKEEPEPTAPAPMPGESAGDAATPAPGGEGGEPQERTE